MEPTKETTTEFTNETNTRARTALANAQVVFWNRPVTQSVIVVLSARPSWLRRTSIPKQTLYPEVTKSSWPLSSRTVR